jgi:hypothetical protein
MVRGGRDLGVMKERKQRRQFIEKLQAHLAERHP